MVAERSHVDAALLLPLLLLMTGCSVALLSQHMAARGIALPEAQAPAWTKYTLNFALSAGAERAAAALSPPTLTGDAVPCLSSRHNLLLAAMGLLDVVGYGLSCVGFTKCGAALSMVLGAAAGQICTAATRTLFLRRPLGTRRAVAVSLVTGGLVVRGADGLRLSMPGPVGDGTVAGMALIVAGAVCYSLLGVGYEWLLQTPGGKLLTQAQINRRMAWVGAIAIGTYQLLHTLPRWHALVAAPVGASGLSWAAVGMHYAALGVLFTVHSHVQGHVFGGHGVVAVGIINAMRAVAVSLASAALFCRPSSGATDQCLTATSLVGALLVTAGAALWASAAQLGGAPATWWSRHAARDSARRLPPRRGRPNKQA